MSGTLYSVTLTNADNTISGAGHLGGGVMVLVNEGTIIATGTNALDIDTGTNAVTNTGTLEATGTGGPVIHNDVVNKVLVSGDGIPTSAGLLWANGGNITIDGNVSGNGTAQISGSATLEFGAASTAKVVIDAHATGTIVLHDFKGVVSGFNGDDHLDLLDVTFGAGTTASYVAN